MYHDAIAVQFCRSAGLSDDKIDVLLTRLATSTGTTSDGSTASHYELPLARPNCNTLSATAT